jgi:hypothetical protein
VSRRRHVLEERVDGPEVQGLPTLPEVQAETPPPEVERRGRKRLDPEHDEAPIMNFRATGELERLARTLMRERDESYSEVCRRAMTIGLRAMAAPPIASRPGKF